MTLKHRIIPIVLWDGQQAVQTTRFQQRRRIGSMPQIIKTFEMRNVDEMIVLDIEAKRMDRDIDMDAMIQFAAGLSMPLAMGGGVNNVAVATELIRRCCDKVVLRSALKGFRFGDPTRKLATIVGAQAIVIAADVIDGWVPVYTSGGILSQKAIEAVDFCKKAAARGAGEILLTSVNRQGTMTGYDLSLIRRVSDAVQCPVIANGGCGSIDHMADALSAGASAVAASTMFAFTAVTPRLAAEKLAARGFQMRVGP